MRRPIVTVALLACTGCLSAVPHAGSASLGGKPKAAPVSDVIDSTFPVSFETPGALPPKEPAINVLAKRAR
jgi:hypothetical protein